MATQAEVRRRVEASVADLDDAIRPLRQAIFGLENRMATQGLRHRVLQLCADVSPVPEITFAGPVDGALPAEDADRLLGLMRVALRLLETPAGQTLICVEAAERLSVVVTATGPALVSANGDGSSRDFARCESRPTRTASRSTSGRPRTGPGWPGACPCIPRAKVPRVSGERP